MELTTSKYTNRAKFILLFGILTLVLSFLLVWDIESKHQRQLALLNQSLHQSLESAAPQQLNQESFQAIFSHQHAHPGASLWISYSLLATLIVSIFSYLYFASIRNATKFAQVKHILDLAPDAIISTNATGIINYANQAAYKLFELEPNDIDALEVECLIPSDLRDIHQAYRKEFQNIPRSVAMVDRNKSLRAQTKLGKEFPAGISLSSYTVDGYKENIVVIKDMTKEVQLQVSANTDSLTGLPNRRKLEDFINASLARARRSNRPLSISIIDIDDFKQINDKYGHLKGDDVLVSFANLLSQTVRSTDCIGRWGGEEFLLIMESTDQEGALNLCEKIRLAVEQTIKIESDSISVSIGLVEFTHHRQINELVSDADRALYLAKNSGKNRVEVVEHERPNIQIISS